VNQDPHNPPTLLLALLGVGIVTLALGVVAFWLALTGRSLRTEVVMQHNALATVQAQAGAQATHSAALEVAAAATATAAAEQVSAAQQTSRAYSRIVRANQLANNALLALDTQPQTALLLAVESVRVQAENGEEPLPESMQRLRSILGSTGGAPLITGAAATTALAVSRDERWLAAGDEAGYVRIWDLHDLSAAPRVLPGHAGPVWDLLFVPSRGQLISAGEDGDLRGWDLEDSPDSDAGVLYAGDDPLYVLALSPAGSQLAAAGVGGDVLLWPADALQDAPARLVGHTDAVNTLAYSPDGRLLASGGDDATVRLWDSAVGGQLAELSDHSGFVNLVLFSPDGAWLASGGSDGQVRLWNVNDLAAGSTLLPGHELAVYVLSFSPNSRFLASADDAGAVRLWNVGEGGGGSLLGRHAGNVRGLAFAQGEDGPVLVSAGYDGQVRLWDYRNPETAPTILRGHDGAVTLLAAPPANGSLTGPSDLLITGGYDQALRVWRLTNPFAEPDRVLPAGRPVADVLVTPDGTRLLASGVDDAAVQVWDLAGGDLTLELAQGGAPVSAIALSSDGRRLWTGREDGTVTAWDVDTGAQSQQFDAGAGAVHVLAENAAGDLLAVGGENGTVQVWQPAAGGLLHTLGGHAAAVTGLGFAADGATLYSASQDGALRLWDMAAGELEQLLSGPEAGLWDLAVQPNGPWLVGAGGDGAVWVWNLDALGFEPAQLRRHRNEVNAVNFSADGAILGSAGADAAVYLWSVANPSAEPLSLLGHRSSVNSLAFAPDVSWVVTAGSDGAIRRWSLNTAMLIDEACRTAGRNLTLEEWTQYFPTGVDQYRKTCPTLAGPVGSAGPAGSAAPTGP